MTSRTINSISFIRRFEWYELILLTAGLLILISVLIIHQFGDFTLWTMAKSLYGLGVIVFAFRA